jgi:hypothetical protein
MGRLGGPRESFFLEGEDAAALAAFCALDPVIS